MIDTESVRLAITTFHNYEKALSYNGQVIISCKDDKGCSAWLKFSKENHRLFINASDSENSFSIHYSDRKWQSSFNEKASDITTENNIVIFSKLYDFIRKIFTPFFCNHTSLKANLKTNFKRRSLITGSKTAKAFKEDIDEVIRILATELKHEFDNKFIVDYSD